MNDTNNSSPAPPGAELGPSGMHLWIEVASSFNLDPLECVNLVAACRQLDVVARLEEIAELEGMTTATAAGGTKLHPAVSEARQARVVLSKLLGAIRLPAVDGKKLTAAGERSQRAARARWGDEPRTRDRHGRSTGAVS